MIRTSVIQQGRRNGKPGCLSGKLLLCCVLLFSLSVVDAREISLANSDTENPAGHMPSTRVAIGILAFRGEAHARDKWQETIEYLNSSFPELHFYLRAFDLPQMRQAVAAQSVSFILTNPGNYIELEAEFGASRIVTLDTGRGSKNGTRGSTGSAIVVRAERHDIRTVADLRNRSLMAVSEQAFGGFQIIWRELVKNGIEPFTDLSTLDFAGFPQDDIAYAVIEGRVDAGILRACVLEGMIEEGKIEKSVLRVLDPVENGDFPCQSSSSLYPDWPFAKLKSTPDKLAKRVAQALLAMPASSRASHSGDYSGWTIPMDYQPVHEVFRVLQIGPYSWMRETHFEQLWQRYRHWIVLFVLSLLWVVWHMVRVEHLVTLRTEQLSKANRKLKQEMDERQKAEERVRLHQTELAHVSRISAAGELASGMAHELNQPLSAINSYSQGTTWRLQAGEIDKDELVEIHQHISRQAERAGTIIERFRGFLRKQEIVCTDVDINHAVNESLELFASEARKRDVTIELDLATRLPPVCAELIQIEQVFLNLMRNAAEAMQQVESGRRILTIRTRNRGDNILVEFSDNGPGLDEQTAKQIFVPFFTTKEEGMGLGLSISRSIVELHGGQLKLHGYGEQGVVLHAIWPVYKGQNIDEF